MKIFGRIIMTNINLEYEIGKGMVAAYIAKMDAICKEKREDIQEYDNEIIDSDRFEYFNREEAVKFVRMWEIITNDISIKDRNIICAAAACDNNLTECLNFFNGKGKSIKNTATLKVMLYNARVAVRNIYEEKYGNHEQS